MRYESKIISKLGKSWKKFAFIIYIEKDAYLIFGREFEQ